MKVTISNEKERKNSCATLPSVIEKLKLLKPYSRTNMLDLIKHQVIDPEPAENELVLFTPRQRRLVEQARSALESGDVATAKQLVKKLESDP